jgi:hypothetical protein
MFDITDLRNPGTRSHVTGKTIFLRIFSKRVIDHIVNESLINARKDSNRFSRSFALSHHEIVLLLALLVGACEHQITDFKQFLRNPARKGLSEFKYSQIRRIFSIQEKTFFTLINDELHDLIKVKYHYNISY